MKSADQFTEKLRERAALPNKLYGASASKTSAALWLPSTNSSAAHVDRDQMNGFLCRVRNGLPPGMAAFCFGKASCQHGVDNFIG
jgi:hypothetical protein